MGRKSIRKRATCSFGEQVLTRLDSIYCCRLSRINVLISMPHSGFCCFFESFPLAGGNKIGRTGHVAIIVDASPNWVRVLEQNWDDKIFAAGTDYSREIPADVTASPDGGPGAFTIRQKYILGWLRIGAELPAAPAAAASAAL